MKKIPVITVLALFSIVGFSQEKLNINTTKSTIKWSGEYAFYYGGHDGILNFKEGHFIKTNDVITGGEFIIDMNSIQSQDMDNEDARTDLDNHLKNEDFFDVRKFPIAQLVFTNVIYESKRRLKIYANLTIKSITHPVNFVADVDYDKKEMTTRFKIDRTRWGVTYNSKEIEGKLKDGLISDAIGFDVKLSL